MKAERAQVLAWFEQYDAAYFGRRWSSAAFTWAGATAASVGRKAICSESRKTGGSW